MHLPHEPGRGGGVLSEALDQDADDEVHRRHRVVEQNHLVRRDRREIGVIGEIRPRRGEGVHGRCPTITRSAGSNRVPLYLLTWFLVNDINFLVMITKKDSSTDMHRRSDRAAVGQRLKAAGLKFTHQRLAIYEALAAGVTHPTPEEDSGLVHEGVALFFL